MLLSYIDTCFQVADIFTKGFPDPNKWSHALDLCQITTKTDELPNSDGGMST